MSVRPPSSRESIHPLLSWFRSVSLVPEWDQGQVRPDVELLCHWLEAWDRWYTHAIADRLNLLYQREVSIAKCVPMKNAHYLGTIAGTCRRVGMDAAMTVDLDDHVDPDVDKVFDLAAEATFSVLAVIAPPPLILATWSGRRKERWRGRLVRALGLGLSIELIGDIASLRALGVFRLEAANRAHLTIRPEDRSGIVRGSARGPEHAGGCFARFRLFIDAEGWIYPCLGFLSDKLGRLGHIGDGVEGNGLLQDCAFDLSRLARAGPEHAQAPATACRENLPLVCERHLAYLHDATATKP